MNYYILLTTIILFIIFTMFIVWHNSREDDVSHNNKHTVYQNYVFYKPTEDQRRNLVGMHFIDEEDKIVNYKFIFYNSQQDDTMTIKYPQQIFIAWNSDAIKSLQNKIQQLEIENSDINTKLVSIQSQKMHIDGEARVNRSALREKEEKLISIESEYAIIKESMKNLQQSEKLAREQITSMEATFKPLREENSQLAQSISMLKSTIETIQIEKEELVKQKDELEMKLREAEEEIKEILSVGEQLESDNVSLREQVAKLTEEYKEAVNVVEAFERISDDNVKSVQQIMELQHIIEENDDAINNMEELISSMKEELELKNSQIEELVDNNNKLVFEIDKLKHYAVSQNKIITELQNGNITADLINEIAQLNLIDDEIKDSIIKEQSQTRGIAKVGHILKTAVASVYSLAPSSAFGDDEEEKIDSLVKEGVKVIIGTTIDESIKEKYKHIRFIDLADSALYTTLFKVIMSVASAITVIVSATQHIREVEKRFYPLNVNVVVLDDELDVFQILDKPGVVHFYEDIKDKVYNLIKLRGQRIVSHIVDTYVHDIVAQFSDLFPKYTALVSNMLYRGSGIKVARSVSGKIEIKDMDDKNRCIVYVAQPDCSLNIGDVKSFGDRFGLKILTITLDYNNVDKDFESLHRLYDCGIRIFIGVRSTYEVQYEALRRLQELYNDVVIISEGSNIDIEKDCKIIRLLESDKVVTKRVHSHLKTIKVRDVDGKELDSEILFVMTPKDYMSDDMNVVTIDEEEEINIEDLVAEMENYDIIAFNATVSELFYDNIDCFPADKLYVRYNDSSINSRLVYKMKEEKRDYNDIVPIHKEGKNAQIMEAIMYSSFIIDMTHLPFDKILEYSHFLRGPFEAIELNSKGDRVEQSLGIYRLVDDEVKIDCVIPKLSYVDDAPVCMINM